MTIKAQIEYWSPKNESVVTKDGFRYLNTRAVINKIIEWEDSKVNIFKKFYKENKKLKYCNGSYYKFKDTNLHNQYVNWYDSLNSNTKFSMYYGKGIVD